MIQEEKIELNLDNPIFVCYLNCENRPRQAAEEMCLRAQRMFNLYSNITVWVLAADRTKVECIYGGSKSMDYLNSILDKFDSFKDFIQTASGSEFKQKFRELFISDLLEDEKDT